MCAADTAHHQGAETHNKRKTCIHDQSLCHSVKRSVLSMSTGWAALCFLSAFGPFCLWGPAFVCVLCLPVGGRVSPRLSLSMSTGRRVCLCSPLPLSAFVGLSLPGRVGVPMSGPPRWTDGQTTIRQKQKSRGQTQLILTVGHGQQATPTYSTQHSTHSTERGPLHSTYATERGATSTYSTTR